jgi:hypothetical protein
VVFQSKIPTERGVSLAIGIQRNADEEFPHVGDLLAASSLDAEGVARAIDVAWAR